MFELLIHCFYLRTSQFTHDEQYQECGQIHTSRNTTPIMIRRCPPPRSPLAPCLQSGLPSPSPAATHLSLCHEAAHTAVATCASRFHRDPGVRVTSSLEKCPPHKALRVGVLSPVKTSGFCPVWGPHREGHYKHSCPGFYKKQTFPSPGAIPGNGVAGCLPWLRNT